MRAPVVCFLFLLLTTAAALAHRTDDDVNAAYHKARDMLDPDGEISLENMEYELDMLYKCEPYTCETQGPAEVTKLSPAEIRWYQTMKTSVMLLRKIYPGYTKKVYCAIQSLLLDPQLCQMHHASELLARLTFLTQRDLASDELVKELNQKERKRRQKKLKSRSE